MLPAGGNFAFDLTLPNQGRYYIYAFLERSDGTPGFQRGNFTIMVGPPTGGEGVIPPGGGGDAPGDGDVPSTETGADEPAAGGGADPGSGSSVPVRQVIPSPRPPSPLPAGEARNAAPQVAVQPLPQLPPAAVVLPGGAADAAPQAIVDDGPLPPAPMARDLWDGVAANPAFSLIDEPRTPPRGGGSPLGAGLLGLGVLALAGVGAAAGERRLALVRRIRS